MVRPSLLDHVTAAARPLVGSRSGKESASGVLTAGAA
jgi:starch synthase